MAESKEAANKESAGSESASKKAANKEAVKDIKAITEDAKRYKCPVEQGILFLDEFIDGPMCGKCLPCPMGSYEMRVRLRRLAAGTGTMGDVDVIKTIAPRMFETSMCKKGKDTAKFIMDTLENSFSTYETHTQGVCPAKECKNLVLYTIVKDRCVSCDDCRQVCKTFAILGEKRLPYLSGFIPYEIVAKRCTKCGDCLTACKYGAIEVVDVVGVGSTAGTAVHCASHG
ncbi:MAG: hypothetical protein HQK89_10875 [Nitrospirae bacterium]|nr:hypothetical protein [Nitrospirota bacterium]